MRVITDPIVDSVAFLTMQFVLPYFIRVSLHLSNVVISLALYSIARIFGQENADKSVQLLATAVRGHSASSMHLHIPSFYLRTFV